MRLIDGEALKYAIDRRMDDSTDESFSEGLAEAMIEIDFMPAIVEFEGDINKVVVKGEEYSRIVRCKDCKYMTEHCDTDGDVYWTCSEWDSGTDYDGFCHLAERKSDETD